ncbi:MAG: ATP-binding cassette domain-containing protein [Betaproteobacteria bacterium]|nr:MAG: ATP-binding cassette domain-containing protein [Betaproteobacteria bacterium]
MRVDVIDCAARHPVAKLDAAPAIIGLTMRFDAGEQVAVIGPSGAGKTTLLHVIACALKPSSGRIELAGSDPWQVDARALRALRGDLFLAAQVPPLPPRQRVVTAVLAGRLPNLSLWQSIRSLFYPAQMELAADALSRFDLDEKLFDRVDRLSGGERQRVGLARGLVTSAKLLLVDEPLSALDPTRSEQAVSALTTAARERGATLIATLHQVDTALRHFPRIIGLRDGALAFDLPASEVTPEILRELYAQKLHELAGPAIDASSFADTPAAPTQPAVMHCR